MLRPIPVNAIVVDVVAGESLVELGSERVGISVTTLSDPRSRLTNVRIGVAFAAPGDWYVITDVIFCSDFFYYDHGGATVPVYGPLMKLAVSNDGATPARITQLVAYAVAH